MIINRNVSLNSNMFNVERVILRSFKIVKIFVIHCHLPFMRERTIPPLQQSIIRHPLQRRIKRPPRPRLLLRQQQTLRIVKSCHVPHTQIYHISIQFQKLHRSLNKTMSYKFPIVLTVKNPLRLHQFIGLIDCRILSYPPTNYHSSQVIISTDNILHRSVVLPILHYDYLLNWIGVKFKKWLQCFIQQIVSSITRYHHSHSRLELSGTIHSRSLRGRPIITFLPFSRRPSPVLTCPLCRFRMSRNLRSWVLVLVKPFRGILNHESFVIDRIAVVSTCAFEPTQLMSPKNCN